MGKIKKWEGAIYIALIFLSLVVLFSLIVCSCAHQQTVMIEEPTFPRVVVKEISADPNKKSGFDPNIAEVSYLQPDLTRGYIKNEAYPLAIRVWWLDEVGGREILLGSEGNNPPGPADFYFGNIREFNFPPGIHRLIVERWEFFRQYGWRKNKKVELLELEVGRLPRGNWFSSPEISHYNWAIVIGPDRSQVGVP